MSEWKHPIRVVARRTGLSPHVIRAWERRYEAITPQRTDTNRRLYSDEDVVRLRVMRRAIELGRSIGQVAHLSTQELEALVDTDDALAVPAAPSSRQREDGLSMRDVRDACVAAIQNLDADRLDDVLVRASVTFTQSEVLQQILLPLMRYVGDQWRDGKLRIVHEHFATVMIRNFMAAITRSNGAHRYAPTIVVTTPGGQSHELGALAAAATAKTVGWKVVYLGPDLPVEDIAAAVAHHKARSLALSIIYPTGDPTVHRDLRRLQSLMPGGVRIFVGGRAAASYADTIREIGASEINDLFVFASRLAEFDGPDESGEN
jgi:DNA-binding transcriptional MerR regulator/methylmalonyl-CoA mutase cobalamin-binding subunit